jgi:hypothetical protein
MVLGNLFLRAKGVCKTMFLSFFLAVEACSKDVLRLVFGHGKSPCFSRWPALRAVDVDVPGSRFASTQIVIFHGWTFYAGS